MADIQYWDDTLTEELEAVQSLLDSIPRKRDPNEKQAAIVRTEKKLRSANGTKRSYKMECRLVADPNQRRRYEKQLSRHDEMWRAMASDIKALKAEAQRGQLFDGADPRDGQKELSAEATGDYMLDEASRVQDKTKDSLGRTAKMVAESKEVGMGTLEELERQRGTIEGIEGDVDRIEDSLVRADKLIKTFGKRMATDKFIQLCACLNVLLMVGVILYATLRGGRLTGNKDTTEPESPVRMLAAYLRGSISTSIEEAWEEVQSDPS